MSSGAGSETELPCVFASSLTLSVKACGLMNTRAQFIVVGLFALVRSSRSAQVLKGINTESCLASATWPLHDRTQNNL